MRRLLSVMTALVFSLALADCGGHGGSGAIPNTPEVGPTQKSSPEPLAQPSSLPFTKDQIRQAKSIFSAHTTCPDGNVADWCATLNVGESYSFGLVLGTYIPDNAYCPGGSEVEIEPPSSDQLNGISVRIVPHQYPINASVQPKNFTVTALPSTIGHPSSVNVTATFTFGFYDPFNSPSCLGFDQMPTGYTDAHIILTGVFPSPSPEPCKQPATPGPVHYKELPLVDKNGRKILSYLYNQTIWMPDDGHDPCFFRKQASGKNRIQSLLDLSNFYRGAQWDEQRLPSDPNRNYGGNGINPDFRDYATIAIGMYAAATSTPIDQVLNIENAVAIFSNFGEEKPAPGFSHLPLRNVDNTSLGYTIYNNNSLACCI